MRLIATSGTLTGSLLDFSGSDDYPTTGWTQGGSSPIQFGAQIEAVGDAGLITTSNVANWGACELVYARNNSTAIVPGTLVHLDKDFNISAVPNTGATGRPIYVTLTNFAVGSTTPQGGWVLRSGICPVVYAVAATTGAMYISASAGQATPTNPTGTKQISNGTCLIAAASTFTRSVTATNGSKQFRVSTTAGIYIGQAISSAGNTPVAAASTVASIDPSGMFINLNNAAVASGTATATFTNTGFGICHMDRASMMTAVT